MKEDVALFEAVELGNYEVIAIKRRQYVELLFFKNLLEKVNNDGVYTVKSSKGVTLAEGEEANLMGLIYDNVFPENGKGGAVVKLGELKVERIFDSAYELMASHRLGIISRAELTKNMGRSLQQGIAATTDMIKRTSNPIPRRQLQNHLKRTARKQMLWAIQNAAQYYVEIPENKKNLRMASLAQLQQL